MIGKLTSAIVMIGLVAMAMGYATFAYFSDTGTSSGNVFSAGSMDLVLTDNNEVELDDVTMSIQADAFAPGDAVSDDIEVENLGSLPGVLDIQFLEAASTSPSGGDLKTVLCVDLLKYGAVDLAAQVVGSGPVGCELTLRDVRVHGAFIDLDDPGRDPGQKLDMAIRFWEGAGNTFQGATSDWTILFNLRQPQGDPLGTLYVGPGGGSGSCTNPAYSAIADAVAAADVGTVVIVCPGTYSIGTLTLGDGFEGGTLKSFNPVALRGEDGGAGATVLAGRVLARANDVSLQGLKIDAAGESIAVRGDMARDRVTLDHLTIENPTQTGIQLDHGTSHQITNSVIQGSGLRGVRVAPTFSSTATNVVIQDNEITASGSHGIEIRGSGHSLASNHIHGNTGWGIMLVTSATGLSINLNQVEDNLDGGIHVNGADHVLVENTASGNDNYGINVNGTSVGAVLVDNVVSDTNGVGLFLGGAGGHAVTGGSVRASQADGLEIQSSSNSVTGTTICGNGLAGGTFQDVRIVAGAADNTLDTVAFATITDDGTNTTIINAQSC